MMKATVTPDTPMGTHVEERAQENILRRIRGNLSQQEAADLCDVSRQTWAAWELGTRPISVQQLNDIREAFQLNDQDVLGIVDWVSAVENQES
jgi:transcriptional regulator with XRE-family HTH domain